MTDDTINIRAIQHYMYCPRRFALLELNCDWAENAFVVKANLMHEHVHSGDHSFSTKSKIVRSSVALYNDHPDYNIFGIADCIEFEKDSGGVFIPELEGVYKVKLVEYKPKPPKDANYHESDAIQVFAQKLCADYVWKCDSEAYIYYSEMKRRIRMPFDTEFEHYDSMLKSYLQNMRLILENASIPDKKQKTKCDGCSMGDMCFPKSSKYNVRDTVMSMNGEN